MTTGARMPSADQAASFTPSWRRPEWTGAPSTSRSTAHGRSTDLSRTPAEAPVRRRRDRSVRELADFLHRAGDEGLIRSGRPDGWVSAVLPEPMNIASRQLTNINPARAADTVVGTRF
ncbi:hypothetical protein ACFYR1_00975 [Streptomyces canus]|uniref:hypothetical protein n=1 Tax=Streptomyces canus TaxID=58343 RepID=UPI0036A047B4